VAYSEDRVWRSPLSLDTKYSIRIFADSGSLVKVIEELVKVTEYLVKVTEYFVKVIEDFVKVIESNSYKFESNTQPKYSSVRSLVRAHL